MGFRDLGAVEGAGNQGFVGAEVVDEDDAVDLGGLVQGAGLPEEFGFFAGALYEQVDLAADPEFLALRLILFWRRMSLRRRASMVGLGTFSPKSKAFAPSSSE